MPGKCQGFYFHIVVGSMLSANLLFPEYRKRVDSMDPEAWYSWDEYLEMTNAIAERLGPTVTKQIGVKVVTQAREAQAAAGFDTTEKMFTDYGAYTASILVGVPPSHKFRTRHYEPGYAVIEVGRSQPIPLIEGYLSGNVTVPGNRLVSLQVESQGTGPSAVDRFHVKWRKA